MKTMLCVLFCGFETLALAGEVIRHTSVMPNEVNIQIAASEETPIGAALAECYVVSNRSSTLASYELKSRVGANLENGRAEELITNETWRLELPPNGTTNVTFVIPHSAYSSVISRTATFNIVVLLDKEDWDMPWLAIRRRSMSVPEVNVDIVRVENTESRYIGITTFRNQFATDSLRVSCCMKVRRFNTGELVSMTQDIVRENIAGGSIVGITNEIAGLSQGEYSVNVFLRSSSFPPMSVSKNICIGE